MRQIIDPKNEKDITDEKIISAWNCMSTMDKAVLHDLERLAKLQCKHPFTLGVVSLTNPTHVTYIDHQLSKASIDLKSERSLFFEEKTLSMPTLVSKIASRFGWDKSGNQIFSLLNDVANADELFKHATFKIISKKSEKLSTIIQNVIETNGEALCSNERKQFVERHAPNTTQKTDIAPKSTGQSAGDEKAPCSPQP